MNIAMHQANKWLHISLVHAFIENSSEFMIPFVIILLCKKEYFDISTHSNIW